MGMQPHTSQDERDQFSARLNQALDSIGAPKKGEGRQGYLGDAAGVSEIAARKWLEAEGMPRMPRIRKLATFLGVSAEWLLTGEEVPGGAGQRAITSAMLDKLPESISLRSRLILIELAHAAGAGTITESELELINGLAEKFTSLKGNHR